MTYEQRQVLTDKFFDECKKIMLSKGKDYSVNGEAFKETNETAIDCNITPEQVLWIGLRKHFSAVRNYIQKGKVESEPIDARLMDLANYVSLIYAMIHRNDKDGINVDSKLEINRL